MAQSRPTAHTADMLLLLTIVGVTLFGLMMITSASSVIAERLRGDVWFYFKHQLINGVGVGTVGLALGYFVPYYQWRRIALPFMILSLVLLILVFVPGLQLAYGGASRWIGLGPLSLQPSEITKFAFILYLAALLDRKSESIHEFRTTVLPFMIVMSIIGILVTLQPDIGTLISITAIAGSMVFIGGFRLTHLTIIGLSLSAIFAILFNTASYRLARILVFLHPELDPQGIGYQINQSLLAVGTGSWWGLGFGRSRQKYQYLPEPAGDSIFAIIAEELGFIRTMLVVLAFLFIGYRGFTIARHAPDIFGRLLASGITAWILMQALINMGAILALTPLTGIPLPFISYGGSALAMTLFASGVLLNISKYTRE